jgi:hypothetical protein
MFTLGDYSHAPLRSMGGTQTQVRHSNVVVGAGIEMQFIGRSEADMLLIRTHYINSRGTFNVFTLPSAIWIGTTDPTPPSYTWRYTEMPRVSEDGNGHYDIAVKMEMMPPDPSGDIASTQDVVILVPLSIITIQGLAPTVEAGSVTIDVPAALITITGLVTDSAPPISVSYPINLLFDGSNGSTTITDSSINNFTATRNGNAQISTAQSVSGGSSLLLDGNGDYVTFGPSSLLSPGTGDFEIACDIRRTSGTEIGAWQLGTVAGGQDAFTAGVLCLLAADYGGSVTLWVISSELGALDLGVALPIGSWRRVRLARFGGLFRVSVAGTQVYSVASTENFSGQYHNIGVASTNLWWNGHIDNFAMAKDGLLAAWP